MKEIKDIYKSACFRSNPMEYLKELRSQTRVMQIQVNIDFVMNNTILSDICRHCGNKIEEKDFSWNASYWTPNLWRPYHISCKEEAKKAETLACQIIDGNCNDCFFFKRGEMKVVLTEQHSFLKQKTAFSWKEKRSWEYGGKKIEQELSMFGLAKIGDEIKFNGFCEKKQIPVQSTPVTCTNYDCFKHRKT